MLQSSCPYQCFCTEILPRQQKELDPLKLSKNPRYTGVAAVVNTGNSFPAVFRDVDLSKIHARFHREEFFRRLKGPQFLQLLARVDEVRKLRFRHSPCVQT